MAEAASAAPFDTSDCIGSDQECTANSDCCAGLSCDTVYAYNTNTNPTCRFARSRTRSKIFGQLSNFLWDNVPPQPTSSSEPSLNPSMEPSMEPTVEPSMQPSIEPTVEPSMQPSFVPSSSCGNLVLKDNATLVSGEYICSPNGRYRFGVDDSDGGVVIWDNDGSAIIWSASGIGVSTTGGRNLRMQPDGNLVLRNVDNDVVWSTWTSQIPNATLTLTNEGMAQIKNSHGFVVWNTGPHSYVLHVNQELSLNEFISSPNHQYQFGVDTEGDVSIWEIHNSESKQKIWSAFTSCCPTAKDWRLIMQSDGNAVLYNSFGSRWSSTTQGNRNSWLYVDNHGRARIQTSISTGSTSTTTILWQTNQCGYINTTTTAPTTVSAIVDDIVDSKTLTHKVMAGYQGWFGTACDAEGYGRWNHWTGGDVPSPDNINFDMWPDVSEFDASNELCDTNFYFNNGQNAKLFSSSNSKTVERHTKWMHEYGIDGVFVQRFLVSVLRDRCIRDLVLNHVRRGSEMYGRVFANMYDVSAAKDVDDVLYEDIKRDWIYLVDDQRILESPSYLYHNGKPVLAIWGFGFEGRPGDPKKVLELIDWFTKSADEKYQVTLMGGIPRGWRTLSIDSKTDKKWKDVYRSYDILSPWTVGRYRSEPSADTFRSDVLEPDLQECDKIGKEYLPVVFPGFSAYNRKRSTKPFNEIKRQGGKFFWRQLYNAIDAGSSQIYVAMFDEVDEGTAIFKTAETANQAPRDGKFVNLDQDGIQNVPSDWYLRLTGNATTMLKDPDTLLEETMPQLPTSL